MCIGAQITPEKTECCGLVGNVSSAHHLIFITTGTQLFWLMVQVLVQMNSPTSLRLSQGFLVFCDKPPKIL